MFELSPLVLKNLARRGCGVDDENPVIAAGQPGQPVTVGEWANVHENYMVAAAQAVE